MCFAIMTILPSKWLNWTGDIFPVFHGGYYINTNDANQTEEYPFCHVQYVQIRRTLAFNNHDLLLFYFSNVVNVDQQYSDLYLNQTGIIVRTESSTAKTIWAKNIVYELTQSLMAISDVSIYDDTIFCLLTVYQKNDHVWVITKVNGDGNILHSYSVINNVDGLPSELHYFTPEIIAATSDGSCIVGMESDFYEGVFGVSSNSQLDATIFSFNSNNEFNWLISLDYLIGRELVSQLIELDSTIYISFNTNKIYLWIWSLNLADGALISTSWIKAGSVVDRSGFGRFKLVLVTQKWLFARDCYQNLNGDMSLFIYENGRSLKLF